MSRKLTTIIIVLFILLLGGAFVGFYLYLNNETGTDPEISPTPSGTPQNLFPFPNNPPPSSPNPNPGQNPPPGVSPNQQLPTSTNKLKKISVEPVAGITFVDRENISKIRYIERKTLPRIYEVSPDDQRQERLLNTDIRSVVYDGVWAEQGRGVAVRYLKDDGTTIEGFYGKLVAMDMTTTTGSRIGASTVAESDTHEFEATFLPQNVTSITSSPKGDKLFYLVSHGNGASGVMINPDGTKKTTLFDSPSDEWIALWPNETTVTLQTKATAHTNGYFYSLNTKTALFQQLIGNIRGLTASLNPAGDTVLYSGSSNGEIVTSLYNVKTGGSFELDVKTFPEKCAWSRIEAAVFCAVPKDLFPAEYPDLWYQGGINFNDTLVKIDSKTGAVELIADLETFGKTTFDAVDLKLNAAENYLAFINKNDQTAWVYDLE